MKGKGYLFAALVAAGCLWVLFSTQTDSPPTIHSPEFADGLGDQLGSAAGGIARLPFEYDDSLATPGDLVAPETRTAKVLRCLKSEGPWDCLGDFNLGHLNPDELASILMASGITDVLKIDFIRRVLSQLPPGETPALMDTTCQLMGGRPSYHFKWFEGAISQMEQENEIWVLDFLTSITACTIFFDDGTDLLPLLVRRIKMESPEVDQIILEGGRGEWGGTPDQIERAFVVTMANFSEDNPQGALDYSLEALRSPFPSDEAANSLAQHSIFFVKILSQRGEVDDAQVENVLGQLFSDIRLQESSALMFLKNIRGDKFGALGAAVVADYRQRAEEIVRRNQ